MNSKVKYTSDTEFEYMRRIASKLGLAMLESDYDVINLKQFRRVEKAINSLFQDFGDLQRKHSMLLEAASETLGFVEATNGDLESVRLLDDILGELEDPCNEK
jgi:hypothetical protein